MYWKVVSELPIALYVGSGLVEDMELINGDWAMGLVGLQAEVLNQVQRYLLA